MNETVISKQLEELTAVIEDLRNQILLLKEENEYLKRKLFKSGQSETVHSQELEQLSLFNEAEEECETEKIQEYTVKRNTQKKPKMDISVKLDKLPQRDEIIDLEDDEKYCDYCGGKLSGVGKQLIRREINYIPGRLECVNIYQKTYECRRCRSKGTPHMFGAGITGALIPHSYASAQSVAYVMKEKYINGVPLYRIEAEWKRLGYDLPRATMANWIIITAHDYLIPIQERMHQLLTDEKYVHADETTVQVLNEVGKKNTTKSYMWVYCSIKEAEKQIRIFDYSPTRAGYNPANFLKGFEGYCITDGYQGYNDLEKVTNVYCWAHARRKYFEALPSDAEKKENTLAAHGLVLIDKLFNVERDIEAETPEEKVKKRKERSLPIINDYFLWCEENIGKVLKGSKIYKAFQYSLNHKKGLSEYINDGLLPMTNSLDERTIRPFTTGRKNWLFSASPKGAEASTAVYSIVETAKANGLDPYHYLCYLLSKVAGTDLSKQPELVDELMPWSEEVKAAFKKVEEEIKTTEAQ